MIEFLFEKKKLDDNEEFRFSGVRMSEVDLHDFLRTLGFLLRRSEIGLHVKSDDNVEHYKVTIEDVPETP